MRRFSDGVCLRKYGSTQVRGQQVGLLGGAVVLHDGVNHFRRQYRKIVFHGVKDEIRVIGRGEWSFLGHGIFRILLGQLAPVRHDARQNFRMQCHHDIKNTLVAQPLLGVALGFTFRYLAPAIMTRGKIPGNDAHECGGDGSERIDDGIGHRLNSFSGAGRVRHAGRRP